MTNPITWKANVFYFFRYAKSIDRATIFPLHPWDVVGVGSQITISLPHGRMFGDQIAVSNRSYFLLSKY